MSLKPDGTMGAIAAACIGKPGWTGKMLADAQLAVERVERVADEQEARDKARDESLRASIAELRAERHRQDAERAQLAMEVARLRNIAETLELALDALAAFGESVTAEKASGRVECHSAPLRGNGGEGA